VVWPSQAAVWEQWFEREGAEADATLGRHEDWMPRSEQEWCNLQPMLESMPEGLVRPLMMRWPSSRDELREDVQLQV
jgi:hypothetical protein